MALGIGYPLGGERDDLKRAFQAELARLAAIASRSNVVEGVMRLRALAEIAGMLDTSALLDLAGRTKAEHAPNEPDGQGLVRSGSR